MALSATVLISLLVALSGGLGSASAVANTSGSANIEYSANILPSLNVTIPVSTVSLTLNPVNASLATSNVPITVGTNNDYGYTLTLSSTNNTTALTRTEELPDHTIPTIDTLTTTEDGYTAEEFTVNRWGYSINNGNYNGYTSGVMLGSSNTRVNADVTNVNFAAKADYTTSAGTYNLGLTFNVVATPVPYTVTYTDNSGDNTVTGAPINPVQTSVGTAGEGVVLTTSIPTRDGYTFTGWCTIATTDEGTVCNSTTYQAGDTYAVQDTDETTIILYAIWEKDKIYIQDVTTANCPTEMTLVYDKRDEQEYNIQKLADNNCWLLDNLRLGSVALTEQLSTSNTNMSPSVAFTLPTSSTSSGFTSYTAAQINTASAITVPSTAYGSASGKIGVYYNYCAASAGTICVSGKTANASYDICPSGWRMPTGGRSGEYQALYTAYSSNDTNFRNALSTPLSGLYNGSQAYDQGSRGYFWSSTYYIDNYTYRLDVDSSYVYPGNSYLREQGYSLRCVTK